MAGPPRVVARARTAVRIALTRRLETLADASDPARWRPVVLVGLSGGADSLALLATTVWVAGRLGLATEAVIIDHGLQEGSERVAEHAAMQAEQLGAAAAHVRRVAVEDGPGGLENAARQARHRALAEVREDRGALAVLLAHTLDDQAEQVLLGLARGGGPRSIAAISPARGVTLRPFLGTDEDESLGLRRADTEEICRLHDLEWWDDPMNADPHHLRARVRHEVLPVLREVLGDQVEENLARASALVREDADHLDREARELSEGLRRPVDGPHDLLALDVHALAAEPTPIRTRILRDVSRRAARAAGGGSGKSLLRRHVREVDALVRSWHGQAPAPLPGTIEVARCDGLLVWRRAPAGTDRRVGHLEGTDQKE
ncbi:tRNA lysidine(34) synthetase TilS [Brachybacterium sp. EF45031]|uniref:tRNA lysidine(34) synthetase TilS n=1 Tax=Brachybacterium sillae TaxID=2810536 RepID=UPI00217F0C41|nr:tRNA lysidine(34) synthetase TilS [Brachybacterium sillae]MCS6712593.1 tRNA lysidine(34) synthetase TilS [Brachybacterium sillae]